MTTLNKLIEQLQAKALEGHGEKKAFVTDSSSGCSLEVLGYVHVTDHVNETGPFDLEPGEQYVSITVGQ